MHMSAAMSDTVSLIYGFEVVQPGVANVYCAVTQHSRNGATFYLENFPSMTGREYRSSHCSLPHVVPIFVLSCHCFAFCFALAFWHLIHARCICLPC